MHSYLIYTGIYHENQLRKLRAYLVEEIERELTRICREYGGRPSGAPVYVFSSSLEENVRKTAEASEAMYRFLQKNHQNLLGFTVLVTAGKDEGEVLNSLILKIPRDNGLWVAPDVQSDFRAYFETVKQQGFFRVEALKTLGPRLEERLPRLLVRHNRLAALRTALEKMEKGSTETFHERTLLIRGQHRSGKRKTFFEALRERYPDDSGMPFIMTFSRDSPGTMEPFTRTVFLGPSDFTDRVSEYLQEDEQQWWEQEGRGFLEETSQGGLCRSSRDQGLVDLVQAFALYLKAFLEFRKELNRPAYIVLDGFQPKAEAAERLQSVLAEFNDNDFLRLVIIRDIEPFGAPEAEGLFEMPRYVVDFRKPEKEEWVELVGKASTRALPSPAKTERLLMEYGSDLYTLFHVFLARERKLDIRGDASGVLVDSLDTETRNILFLAHAASGLANRRLLTERLGTEDEIVFGECARYDSLMHLGFIREDADGRVRFLPGASVVSSLSSSENIRSAAAFGRFMYKRLEDGEPVDALRLFRYIEKWGPSESGIAVLHGLLEKLLDNRQLRNAGVILKSAPLMNSEMNGDDRETLGQVLGAARLRYMLLTAGPEEIHALIRDGVVAPVVERGDFAGSFRLNQARLFYAAFRWDEAAGAAKEALFFFQKQGNHKGETLAHQELALALLASGRVRDALEHFEIARRIGTQIGAAWAVLRAASLEAVGRFIFGNLSRSSRDCDELRILAHEHGRRDIWLLLTLCRVRIDWELGRYPEAASLASEGKDTADFYGLEREADVFEVWYGRCLLAEGKKKGKAVLQNARNQREALAFLAEAAWLEGNIEAAGNFILPALELQRQTVRVQGESEDWSDGFFPIEGRLGDSSQPLDILGEWIEAFAAFVGAEDKGLPAVDRLSGMISSEGWRFPRPFRYVYALWALLSSEEVNSEVQTRHVSQAFNELQLRAARFDDNQTKRAWLSDNYWNKRIMDEAHRRKLL